MAAGEPLPTDVPLLRGLFGVLQTGARQGLDTSTIWSNLRQAAGNWQLQSQGAPQPYNPTVAEAAGATALSAMGIRGDTVSTFRGVAGNWLRAKQELAQLGENSQVTAGSIFTPPWSKTSGSAVPSRYRIRTQWQTQSAAGDVFTRWKQDEITGPLSTLADALAQAAPDPATDSGRMLLSGIAPPQLVDMEIEQL